MTLQPLALVGPITTIGPTLRIWPLHIQPKTLAAVGAAPLYPVGTPMSIDATTKFWVVWSNTSGGQEHDIVKGFLSEATQTHATLQVLAPMIMAGDLHFDDIPVPTGESSANLKTALRKGPRTLDLNITGLDQVE